MNNNRGLLFPQNKTKDVRIIIFLSVPLTPMLEVFENSVFGDWWFVKFLLVVMALNTLLGVNNSICS